MDSCDDWFGAIVMRYGRVPCHPRQLSRLVRRVVPGPVLTTRPMIPLLEQIPTAGTDATLHRVVTDGPLLMPSPVIMTLLRLLVSLLRTGVITW